MKHMLLVANHGALGGGEVMLLESGRLLSGLGLRPVVVAPEHPGGVAAAARALDLDVVTYAAVPGGAVQSLLRLRRAVSRAQKDYPDAVVWCHGLGAAVATAGFGGRVVQLHRAPDPNQLPLVLLACGGALDVIVPSADTLETVPAVVRRRCHVLQNWTSSIERQEHRPSGASELVRVGFLGRLAPGKGLTDLALAVRRMRSSEPGSNITLKIGGEPHFVGTTEQMAVERALEPLGTHVQRCGWVDRLEFLQSIDVLVCPSRWPESFGLVVAEAMAAGVPVVVTDAGALPEVVGEAHPYIVRAGDVADLARVLKRAVGDLGTAYGHEVVAAQRRRWVEYWSPEAGLERLTAALSRWGVHV